MYSEGNRFEPPLPSSTGQGAVVSSKLKVACSSPWLVSMVQLLPLHGLLSTQQPKWILKPMSSLCSEPSTGFLSHSQSWSAASCRPTPFAPHHLWNPVPLLPCSLSCNHTELPAWPLSRAISPFLSGMPPNRYCKTPYHLCRAPLMTIVPWSLSSSWPSLGKKRPILFLPGCTDTLLLYSSV